MPDTSRCHLIFVVLHSSCGGEELADDRELLFSKAFRVVAGPRYNEVSHRLRVSRNILFYEVTLEPDTPWESLRDRVYPALARYLKYKSIAPDSAEGVVVALFFREEFYLIEGREFLAAFREIEGLDPEAFRLRVLSWLAETEGEEKTREGMKVEDPFRRDLPAARK
jgi:hypothetical protein